jgi:ethanolamine ammonia-lyase small subunit
MAEPPESPRPTTLADTSITQPDAWHTLRRYTPARIALGRVGASLPTGEVLDFSMAHARARDAVHLPFDPETLASALKQAGFSTIEVRSLAANRSEYLRRPDLGRRLDPACGPLLRDDAAPIHRLTMIVGDGLSALAPARHALPLLLELQAQLAQIQTWSLDSIILANQARVALSDQIGQLRGAEAAVILLGERPGLSSPDSLGVYLTYAPRHGRSDAERNCLSNIRHEGLSYPEAAYKLLYLLEQARTAGASGVVIKDSSDWSAATSLPAQGSKQFSS